jgi:ParB family transcriptional regulator, chromosome partitioning protein
MSSAKMSEIQQVAVSDIVITEERLRPANESAVESIMASAEELSGIQNPILLRKIRRTKGDSLVLMDGGHRLEAAKRMGSTTIDAIVHVDITDEEARLIEIDMNVAGATLCPLDEAVFLAERKRVYEDIHPEAKRGYVGNAASRALTANLAVSSFVKATSEATGVSERKIFRRVATGLVLSKREVAKLRQAPQTIKAGDVEKLGKIKEPRVRVDVIERIASGKSKNVTEALQIVWPKKSKHKDPIDEAHMKLVGQWKRSSKVVKARFVRDLETELTSLIAELGGSDGGK